MDAHFLLCIRVACSRWCSLNNDGVITCDEFVHVLTRPTPRGQPMARQDAINMFRDADADGDGVVSLEEFALSWAHEQVTTARDEARRKEEEIERAVRETLSTQVFPAYTGLKKSFDSYDTSGAGYITYDQFAQALMRQFGPDVLAEDVQALARRFDVDGNGLIDYDEFQRAFGPDGAAAAPPPRRARIASNPVRSVASVPARPPPDDPAMIARCERIEDLLREKLEEKYTSLREMFKGVNEARDGFIDVAEFRRVFARCSVTVPPGHMDMLVARFDRDNNGRVDFNEFAKWMAPNYHSSQRHHSNQRYGA